MTERELYPEGNLAIYQQKVEEAEQEIAKLETDLRMSDEVAAMLMNPGWKALTDRLKTVADNSLSVLRSKATTPHQQGWHQGRLDILDAIMRVQKMTQAEIDDTLLRIRVLRDKLSEYQEVLR